MTLEVHQLNGSGWALGNTTATAFRESFADHLWPGPCPCQVEAIRCKIDRSQLHMGLEEETLRSAWNFQHGGQFFILFWDGCRGQNQKVRFQLHSFL